jgi:hypothetical protein
MSPVLDLMGQPDIIDDDFLLQGAEQPNGLLAEWIDAERCLDRDLTLVVAVDADDVPAGKDQRARIGLLVPVEEVAEEGDRLDALRTTGSQRPFQRSYRSVDV